MFAILSSVFIEANFVAQWSMLLERLWMGLLHHQSTILRD